MTTENISPISSSNSKSHHRRNKLKKSNENISPTNANDWSKDFLFLIKNFYFFLFLAITFCIVGTACTNQRLLSSLEDRYVYECIDDERQVIRSLIETKTLLSQRQLRIYIV